MAELLVKSLGRDGAEAHGRRAAALYGPSHPLTEYWAAVLTQIEAMPR
jgi:hypothetical protein